MANTIPNFDFASTAKITRKTLERLVPFSKMQSASSESNPLLDKTLTKINGFLKLLDSSISTAGLAYQFATAMVSYGKENKESAATTNEDLPSLASKGSGLAQEVATGFKEIEQAVYKIAASTKDNMLAVRIPPDSTQTVTINMHLKDVGTDLVANLKLFTQFSHASEEIANWWARVKNELVSDTAGLLRISTPESKPDQFALWSSIEENLLEYYTIVNVAQQQFPNLLGQSIAAWQLAASLSDPNIHSLEVGHGQGPTPTRGTIGRFLSRFFDLKKRTSNSQGEETVNGRATPSKPDNDANITSGSSNQHAPDKDRKRFLKGCISAGLICN